MKALVLEGPSEVALHDVDIPELENGQTLIRVTHSGVCGTDQKIFQGNISVNHPLVMGHEMVGTIVEGRSRDGAGQGTKVIVNPTISCGRCFHCEIGQEHICPNSKGLGWDINGGFAEYMVAPSAQVYTLPENVELGEAPLIQVLSTVVHAHRRVPIFAGDVVGVTGLGVTGQLHIQMAKMRGAGTVIGVSRNGWKRELAEQLGADITAESGAEAKEKILQATGGRGCDVIIETSGVVPVLAESIDLVRVGGRMMLFGIYTATEGELPFYQLYYKELDVINARAAKGEDFPTSIDLVSRGMIRLGPLITHVLELAELDQALGMLVTGQSDRMKIILEH